MTDVRALLPSSPSLGQVKRQRVGQDESERIRRSPWTVAPARSTIRVHGCKSAPASTIAMGAVGSSGSGTGRNRPHLSGM